MYNTTEEFTDCYISGTLNEFNEKLFSDYIDFNFYCDDLCDYFNVDIQYKNGCDCVKNYDDDLSCECSNDINYWDDKFMWNKIPMFPKNMKFQKYYDNIFPKREFKNKNFYYLPNGCKIIYTAYIDKELTDAFDIQRNITYTFINDALVLVKDSMNGWFGSMYENYHAPESKMFKTYIDKLEKYTKENDFSKENFYYGIKYINFCCDDML